MLESERSLARASACGYLLGGDLIRCPYCGDPLHLVGHEAKKHHCNWFAMLSDRIEKYQGDGFC